MLVGCEFSGAVTETFRRKGHDAWSCDLIPSTGTKFHIQDDLQKALLLEQWDMLVAFPPCTYLCSSGLHWNKKVPERLNLTEQAAEFFLSLATADVPKIALENLIGCMSTRFRKPDQIIQPWMFGHSVNKSTCLWLKNLPKLQPTNVVPQDEVITFPNGKRQSKWYYETSLARHEDRGSIRSVTFPGIAQAMADQWG